MFSFVCLLLYAVLSLHFVCSLCMCICFACTVHILHMSSMCVGQTHTKGVRTIDSFRVNGCKWLVTGFNTAGTD